ncbi:nucleotidyltransferase domain-containing protein [Candidatus Pacearchaeota archaeon]|nr:nucleotidyltransferase domain-containing protein [Candidatus Pacearchaeota archaeon]
MESKKKGNLVDSLAGVKKYDGKLVPETGGMPSLAGKGTEQQAHAKHIIDFEKLKNKLEDFKKKIVKKFNFTRAIGILPPTSFPMFEEDENIPKEIVATKPIHAIMIIPEEQYKNMNKIKPEVVKYAKESGENLWVHIKTSEIDLWNYGLDSKFEFLDAISASFPLYDNGFLGALRAANIHKTLVLNWLNVGRIHYVATYAIGGSLVRGTADKTSDVDTFVIIDDTDVKRMSRIELLEKLRGKIVYEFVKEATVLAGVKNILNVQVYLLTDFWQSVKDAQPVMFTFIRDGVPLYDRGTFIPWKRLLQMGRIKPSPEAIDLYMKEGDRTEEIVKRRLMDAMVDVYWGVVTPTQAMMMLAGHAPPVPKTIVQEVKEVLVDKEKVMTEKEIKTLEKVVKLYKDYEHGKLKDIPGKDIDALVQESKDYSNKMKELREKLEKKIQEKQAEKIHEETFSLMTKIFGPKGQDELVKDFEKEMIDKGRIQERMLSIAKEVAKLKSKDKGSKKLALTEMQRTMRESSDLIEALTEYLQRKELVAAERGIMIIQHGEKKAEIVATDKGFFVVDEGKIRKIDLENKKLTDVDRKEFESALDNTKERFKFNVPSQVMEILKKELGEFSVEF